MFWLCLFCLIVSGCRNPSATNAISPEQEKTVGDWAAAQIQSESVGPMDPSITAQVATITKRLNTAVDVKPLPRVLVSDSDAYTAASLPGGWVVVSAKMVTLLGANPDALAGILAHEYAHVEDDDALKQMTGAMGADTMVSLTIQGKYTEASNVAVQLMNFSHNMDDEEKADTEGVRIASSAGYDPKGILTAINTLEAVTPLSDAQWLAVHPVNAKRLRMLAGDVAVYAADQQKK